MKSFVNRINQLRFLVKVAVIILVVMIAVGISFLFTQDLTYRTFSDRMTWGAIVCILIAGMGLLSMAGLYRDLGLPDVITRKEQASRLMDVHLELRARIEKRYDFCILFFLVGLGCIALSAILQVIGANLWPAV
jgi:hypothetical protein